MKIRDLKEVYANYEKVKVIEVTDEITVHKSVIFFDFLLRAGNEILDREITGIYPAFDHKKAESYIKVYVYA